MSTVEQESKVTLTCTECSFKIYDEVWIWKCPKCNSPLETNYNLDNKSLKDIIKVRYPGIWRYLEVLPVSGKYVTYLGEGSTPTLVREYHGLKLLIKLEYLNPTGSFKDRGSAVTISKILELGKTKISEDSSGNAGLSMAAYSSAYSIKCRVYVPTDAPETKKKLIELYGAELVTCRSREEAYVRAIEAEKEGFTYVGHLWNPVYIDGTKTIMYEFIEELLHRFDRKYEITDVVLPVGSGTLILGIYKGFTELKTVGILHEIPRIIAVQGTEVCPLTNYVKSLSSKGTSKLANGLRVPNPPRLKSIVSALRLTNGLCVLVSDVEIS